jgi:hypothetical protein
MDVLLLTASYQLYSLYTVPFSSFSSKICFLYILDMVYMDVLLLTGCSELHHTNCSQYQYVPFSSLASCVDGDKEIFPSKSIEVTALPISNSFFYKMLVMVWITFQDLRLLRIDTLTVQLSRYDMVCSQGWLFLFLISMLVWWMQAILFGQQNSLLLLYSILYAYINIVTFYMLLFIIC